MRDWSIIGILAMMALILGSLITDKHNDRYVRAIIGESANQGYDGMLAVACAIRNRGNLDGVYGLDANLKTWDMAKRAWRDSKDRDVTCGATHWENIKRFGEPKWASYMVETYRYKDHVFMRRKEK